MSVTVGRSVKDFRRWRLEIVRPHIKETGVALHQKAHIQLSNGVIFGTPVGNPSLWKSPPPPGYTGGRARGSWQSSVDAPILSEPGGVDKNGSNTAQAGENVARSITFASRSFIASAIPYMIRLNEGWSKQVPRDFIGRAFDQVRAQFR